MDACEKCGLPVPAAKTVPEHLQTLHLVVAEELPPHVERTESALFGKNRDLLVRDHALPCWACGSTVDLQVHHLVEWATWNWVDPVKMTTKLAVIDPYGFSKMKMGSVIDSPDDIRNLIVLCQPCHTGKGKGIHYVPMPIWLPQAVVQDGHSFEDPGLHKELISRYDQEDPTHQAMPTTDTCACDSKTSQESNPE